MGGTLENVLAIVLALAIPIVLIVGLVYAYVSKNRNAYRLRSEILHSQLDPQTVALLLQKSGNPASEQKNYATLRTALCFIFMGVGALVAHAFFNSGLMFWLIVGMSVGVGLLISFIIEWRLSNRRPAGDTSADDEPVAADNDQDE